MPNRNLKFLYLAFSLILFYCIFSHFIKVHSSRTHCKYSIIEIPHTDSYKKHFLNASRAITDNNYSHFSHRWQIVGKTRPLYPLHLLHYMVILGFLFDLIALLLYKIPHPKHSFSENSISSICSEVDSINISVLVNVTYSFFIISPLTRFWYRSDRNTSFLASISHAVIT